MKTVFDIDGTVMDTVTNVIWRAARHFGVQPSRLEPKHYNSIHECISRNAMGLEAILRPKDEDVVDWVNSQWRGEEVYLTSEPFEGYKDLVILNTLHSYLSYRPHGLTGVTRNHLKLWGIKNAERATCIGGSGNPKTSYLKHLGATHYVDDDGLTADTLCRHGVCDVVLIRKGYNTEYGAKTYDNGSKLTVVGSLKRAIEFLRHEENTWHRGK